MQNTDFFFKLYWENTDENWENTACFWIGNEADIRRQKLPNKITERLHIVTKDNISLSISVLLLFRHYVSHKITFGAPSSGGVLCSACGAFISICFGCSKEPS